jgi:hypothetical protein
MRDDGTSTSGQLGPAGFGAAHDLAHYVVESAMKTQDGFYGLLAGGMDIADFARKGAAREISDAAIAVECAVGQFTELAPDARVLAAEELNWLIAEAVRGVRPKAAPPSFDEPTLAAMRARHRELLRRWRDLPPGGTLELDWPA